jgi:hypothetical protein
VLSSSYGWSGSSMESRTWWGASESMRLPVVETSMVQVMT